MASTLAGAQAGTARGDDLRSLRDQLLTALREVEDEIAGNAVETPR